MTYGIACVSRSCHVCPTRILTYLIEVEREVAGDRAVESGLEVGSPLVLELVRSALIVAANTCNTGVEGLVERAGLKQGLERAFKWG